MSANKKRLISMRKSDIPKILAANKGLMQVHGEGDIIVESALGKTIKLENVPDLAAYLLTISCINKRGGMTVFFMS